MDITYNLKNIHVKSFTQLPLPIIEPKRILLQFSCSIWLLSRPGDQFKKIGQLFISYYVWKLDSVQGHP
jgi:hypothetical protein